MPTSTPPLSQDFRDLLSALCDADARFLVVGVEPGRVDVLTKVTGLEFSTAWTNKIEVLFGDVRAHVIGLADLMTNKRAAARPQDVADVAAFDRLARAKARKGRRS